MHACFQCDGACYCHGDIDDCPVETPEYAYAHCTGCGCSEDEPDDYEYDEDRVMKHKSEKLVDVLAVNLLSKAVRVLARDKTEKNAEAIIEMAVMRRGVGEEFYVMHSATRYNDGDVYVS